MTIHDELDAIDAGMAQALAEQDATRFASYYTDDARMLFHGQPNIRGRAEIEAEVRDWVANGPVTLRFETGEVIADGSLVVDVGAIGSVVNLAARLCAEAADGMVLASARTAAAAGDLAVAEPLEPATLKGFARPVAAVRLTGLRTFGSPPERGSGARPNRGRTQR